MNPIHGSTGGRHGEFRSSRQADGQLTVPESCWHMGGAFGIHLDRVLLHVNDFVVGLLGEGDWIFQFVNIRLLYNTLSKICTYIGAVWHLVH